MPLANSLNLHVEGTTTFSLAAQQNAYPLFRQIQIQFPDSLIQDGIDSLDNFVVRMSCDSDLIGEEEWVVDHLGSGQTLTLPQRAIVVSRESLLSLSEIVTLNVEFKAVHTDTDTILASHVMRVDVLPANYWGGESRQPELLAAFIRPNGTFVESLVRQTTELMASMGEGRVADGYQSNTRERPFLMASALWNVVFGQKLSYVSPPSSFARTGQRIRLPSEISGSKLCACLDVSVMFASCLELMGLNTVIALTEGHAFVGVWLIDERFPVLTNDDPMDLRKRVDSRDIVFFEGTLVTNGSPVTFNEACLAAREYIDEDKESDFVYVIDIAQARARGIKPLSTSEAPQKEQAASEETILPPPVIPPLPPVRADERVVEETPETRIDAWQRKLLDLTKKNSLLSFKDRAVAIRIYCPEIGAMEDQLAAGAEFSFLSAEDSPLNDAERSNDLFRLQGGNDLHRSFALEQLHRKVMIANVSKKRMEHCALSLLRKAKNDLEEGGSNTLFLALGMLRWKENPEDDRSYRAPLILIPVQLSRKTAKAKIKLKQLPDESPIFNMTLIEFLQTEYEIDLSQFREELPRDESGVDVPLIWATVRAAIAEQPGFEVVEELVLASFSFAKYLMWRDLKDRIEDLKQNPFVKHLVDSPEDAYAQDSRFVANDQVDEKVDPDKVFTPLNCDSYQLVAVEASGRPQDFVLEGPPGTGKSETIANIICHNLAIGRKVLFVAEKMAALNVVYQRMKKVGLEHLCLELHSNKANKKAVLEQFRNSVSKREMAQENNWVERAKKLKSTRDQLNLYVSALHEKRHYDLSTRQVISRLSLYKEQHTLAFPWSIGLDAGPIKTADELDSMLDTVGHAALSYTDIQHIDTHAFHSITSVNWSNAWQSEVVACLNDLKQCIANLTKASQALSTDFELTIETQTLQTLERMQGIAQVVEVADAHPIGYLFGKGVKETLTELEQLQKEKDSFEETSATIAHGINPERLSQTPVDEWLSLAERGEGGWFKRFIARWKLNRQAKKLGYTKFKDLKVIAHFKLALKLYESITRIAPKFESSGVWQGWETSSESLNTAVSRSQKTFNQISGGVSLASDVPKFLTLLKTRLVDGRDFLEHSNTLQFSSEYQSAWNAYQSAITQAETLGIKLDSGIEIKQVDSVLDIIILGESKLKPWVEWQQSVEQLKRFDLQVVADQLIAGTLMPEEAKEVVFTGFCRWLAPQLIDESEILRTFKASSHEQLLEDFREMDEHLAKTTSEYIAATAAEKMPNPLEKDQSKEFGLLARELQKKTRHKPIRTLINDMGENLLKLTPCLMMSPLSVAQFLPSTFNGFDLVLFDEASQITTWDSVGAIARGRNVIVVGDPKQMPPTNFFGGSVSSDNPDEEDLESILDQALAARLPHRRLNGHYRSRHETLIAFSNNKYYDNQLVTYPACDTKESAVSLHRVDGIYSQGKGGRNNAIEAAAVVEEIVRRLTTPLLQDQSIGVVTLNAEQQRLIDDLLDDARRKNPGIEPYFNNEDGNEGVFVKNLESVQGDERDIIMLSLGFGPTSPEAKTMSMNLGPLNKQGGERRLNVAITRAKYEVLVFSSFDSSMIDLSRTSALAIEHLKHYLEFAEKGTVALAQQASAAYGVDQFDSDFEQSVAVALREKGWKIQTQIGVSKFRIDLGVIHPEHPGTYLAGIECDGATYHSSPSARDRDRVRHIILENLGWTLIRLWSTDYFQDPQMAIDRIDSKLRELLLAEKSASRPEQGEECDVDCQEDQLVS